MNFRQLDLNLLRVLAAIHRTGSVTLAGKTLALSPAVLAQLLALETLVTGHEEFDPASSDMHWRLSLSDLGEMLFLPELAGAMRSQAPGARLSNISVAS